MGAPILAETTTIFFILQQLQFFYINQIAETPGLTLVLHQLSFRNERNSQPRRFYLPPVHPHFIKAHVADRREDVNMVFMRAKTEMTFVIQQVMSLQAID